MCIRDRLYTISRRHINDTFAEHGGFDLVIDLHRDSAPRSASILESDGVTYAKMMFVVGMKSSNAAHVMEHSRQLTDKINQVMPGIMRSVFERQSVYNQDIDVYKRQVYSRALDFREQFYFVQKQRGIRQLKPIQAGMLVMISALLLAGVQAGLVRSGC